MRARKQPTAQRPGLRALALLRGNGDTPMSPASVAVVIGGGEARVRHVLEDLVRRHLAVRVKDCGRVLYRAATQQPEQGVGHER